MSEKEKQVDFKVTRCDRRITKKGETYYALELKGMDGNKNEARIWNDVILGVKNEFLPQEGQYWGSVKYRENVFNGQKQLIIEDYNIYKLEFVPEDVREHFEEKPAVDVGRVIDRMFEWPFWDQGMYSLMQKVREHFQKDGVWEKIKEIPAGASYHHNVRGGFLLHIDEMLSFSEQLCDVSVFKDKKECLVIGPDHYPGLIDYQILRAGIVLHDIGKLYDYDEKTLQYQSHRVSECLEHTIVGILMVERYWVNDSGEALDRGLRLMHALAAHHGPEMGAVKPKTPEAIMLHHIDMLSANLDVLRRAYDNVTKTGNLPDYSKMLGVRPFIPTHFPLNESTYPRREETGQVEAETTESRNEDTKDLTEIHPKLPWE